MAKPMHHKLFIRVLTLSSIQPFIINANYNNCLCTLYNYVLLYFHTRWRGRIYDPTGRKYTYYYNTITHTYEYICQTKICANAVLLLCVWCEYNLVVDPIALPWYSSTSGMDVWIMMITLLKSSLNSAHMHKQTYCVVCRMKCLHAVSFKGSLVLHKLKHKWKQFSNVRFMESSWCKYSAHFVWNNNMAIFIVIVLNYTQLTNTKMLCIPLNITVFSNSPKM